MSNVDRNNSRHVYHPYIATLIATSSVTAITTGDSRYACSSPLATQMLPSNATATVAETTTTPACVPVTA